jgi:hypothetical protein
MPKTVFEIGEKGREPALFQPSGLSIRSRWIG